MSKIKIELTERELELILESLEEGPAWKPGEKYEEFWKLWADLKVLSVSEKTKKELNLWAAENGYFWEGLENE